MKLPTIQEQIIWAENTMAKIIDEEKAYFADCTHDIGLSIDFGLDQAINELKTLKQQLNK